MSVIFDILHLAVAAVLAMIGADYEREEDCPPVQFQPSAEVRMISPDVIGPDSAAHRAGDGHELVMASDCESSRSAIRFPAL